MCDPNNLADWLVEVDPRFRQYTYGLVQSGVDRQSIQSLTDLQLHHDCHIENSFHRAKILAANRRPIKPCVTDAQPPGPDVFISYRRTTGSQLARSVGLLGEDMGKLNDVWKKQLKHLKEINLGSVRICG